MTFNEWYDQLCEKTYRAVFKWLALSFPLVVIFVFIDIFDAKSKGFSPLTTSLLQFYFWICMVCYIGFLIRVIFMKKNV
jgi:hypothetical protein